MPILKIKNKVTVGAPIASQMDAKELVYHEFDDSLYYKRESDNVVIKVNETASGSGISHPQAMSRISLGF